MKTHAGLFSYAFQNETEHSAFLLKRFRNLQNKYIFLKMFAGADGSSILIETMALVFPQNLNIKCMWNQ